MAKSMVGAQANAPVLVPTEHQTILHGRSPFVHTFQTGKNKYVLDVNTNRVVRVDPAVWDIVSEYGTVETARLVERFTDRYTPAEIHAACGNIATTQERDGLLLPRNFELAAPPDLATMQDSIAHKRGQLTLCVTEECNFRCRCCIYGDAYRVWRDHSSRRMSWEVAQRAMDDYIHHSDASHRRCIAFYGGEPLLNVELIKRCVWYARECLGAAVTFEVNTNGSLLGGETADFLAAEDVSILVSLNGPRPVHDYHRRFADGTGTWDIVTRNIRDFVSKHPKYARNEMQGPFLIVEAMLAPLLNLLEVEEFFCSRLSDVLGCSPEVILSEMRTNGSRYHESLASDDRIIPGMETLYRRFVAGLAGNKLNEDPLGRQWLIQRQLFERPFERFLGRKTGRPGGPLLDGRSRLNAICTPGGAGVFVSVDGKYYPCVRLPECEEFRIGDVWSGLDAARSYELKRRYLEASGAECGQCWCVNLCPMHCCSDVREGAKVTPASKRKACDEYRAKTHNMLIDLFGILEVNPRAFDYLRRGPEHGHNNHESGAAGPAQAERKEAGQ